MKKKSSSSISRRQFITRTAAVSPFLFLPSHVALGKDTASGKAPSGKVNLACIGIGNRGAQDLGSMMRTELVNVVALCDVGMGEKHTLGSIKKHPNAKRYQDFRKMFDEMADQIDAVLVATPDHAHFAHTMLAMSLGKHVYTEKPLAHTFQQNDLLIDLAKRSGVATQMGNQGHSGANYFQFKAWQKAGIIKDITKVTANMNKVRRWHGEKWDAYPSEPVPETLDWDSWICTAVEHPYSKELHPGEWRGWFDYGCGAFGDWGPHILDTVHRFLDLGLPSKTVAVTRDGPSDFIFPQASTIRFEFPKRGEMPACDVTWYDGVKNFPPVIPEVDTKGKPYKPGPGKILHRADGLVFQGGSHSSPLRIIPRARMVEMKDELPRITGKHSDHFKNFILACKGEEETRSPFSVGGALTQVFNLGCIAQRLGGAIEFDRKTRQITNNKVANAMLAPPARKGWEQFYKL